MKNMKKGDFVVIAAIILLSLSMIFAFSKKLKHRQPGEKYISIQVEGQEIQQVFFDPDVIGTTIPIESKYGRNVLLVEEDSCRVIEADCPDQIDVLQGKIYDVGEMLVCLPHRLIIEIKTVDEQYGQEVDMINR